MAMSTKRHFTLADAMILVAGSAMGASWSKILVDRWAQTRVMFGEERFAPPWYSEWALAVVVLFAALSMALFACRLIPPRPRWRRIARQPGMTASLAVLVLSTGQAINTALVSHRLPYVYVMGKTFAPFQYFASSLIELRRSVGIAVAVTWIILVLGRWWRPEPSWIDRAGRLLGLYWIGMYLYEHMRAFMSHFF